MIQPTHGEHAAQRAREAYKKGDSAAALKFLGVALHDAPLNPRWLQLLDEILANTPTAAEMLRPEKGQQLSATDGAMLALAEARHGDINTGLHLLAQIVHVMPDPRFALWLPRMIADSGSAQATDPDVLNMLLTETLSKYGGEFVADPDEREALQTLQPAIEWVRQTHLDDPKFEGRAFSFYYQILLPEAMMDIAESALDRGILRRDPYYGGIYYLAWALAADPTNDRARARLDKLIADTEKPTELVPLQEGIDPPNAAMAAYIEVSAGDFVKGLKAMEEVIHVTGEVRYLPWIVEWFALPSMRNVDRMTQLRLLFSLVSRLPSEHSISPGTLQLVQRLIPAIEAVVNLDPEDITGQLMLSRAYREVQRYDEALQVAKKAFNDMPSKMTAVFLAGAYRAKGAVDKAKDAFDKALGYDPEDDSIMIDLGDMLCEVGRLDEGLAYYNKAIAIDPEHPWARPYALYYRWFQSRDETLIEELRAYYEKHPDNAQVPSLLNHIETLQAPYFRYLPTASEATINALRQWLQESEPEPDNFELKITVSHLEAPSAYVGIRLMLDALGLPSEKFTVEVERIPDPDPRQPIAEVEVQLWQYEGKNAQATLPAPDKSLQKTVARLAERPYGVHDWHVLAEQAAAMLSTGDRDALLSVMLHPPKVPAGFTAWDWVQRVQIAVALIISELDGGWETSVRRKTLFSLVRGPMDWSVTAAIIALTHLAEHSPYIADDIRDVLLERRQHIPNDGYTPYHLPLLEALLRLPNVDDELKATLREERKVLL